MWSLFTSAEIYWFEEWSTHHRKLASSVKTEYQVSGVAHRHADFYMETEEHGIFINYGWKGTISKYTGNRPFSCYAPTADVPCETRRKWTIAEVF